MNGPPRPVTVLFVVEGERPGGRPAPARLPQGGHRVSRPRPSAGPATRRRAAAAAAGLRCSPCARGSCRRAPAAAGKHGSSGGDEPIEINADRLVLEQDQQLATFSATSTRSRATPPCAPTSCASTTPSSRGAAGRRPSDPEHPADRGRGQRAHHPARRDRGGRQRRLRRPRRQDDARGQRRAHPGQERGPRRPAGHRPRTGVSTVSAPAAGRQARPAGPRPVRARAEPGGP